MDYLEKARELVEILPTIAHSHQKRAVEKVSKGECHILGMLCIHNGELVAGDIARKTNVSTARVAAVIKSLEEKDYVSRVPVEGDRRKTKVIITDKGREVSEELVREAITKTSSFLEYLGPEDAENFIRIVHKMKGYFEQ